MGLSKVSAMMTAFWAATVFLMWTVFSFSCHWYAKRFLHESGPDRDEGDNDYRSSDKQVVSPIQLSLLLTFAQISPFIFNSEGVTGQSRVTFLILITHGAATYATNYGLTTAQAPCVLIIKLLEPIMSAFLLWQIRGTPVTLMVTTSLLCLVIGATGFIHSNHTDHISTDVIIGYISACISNLLYGFRNMLIKHFSAPTDLQFASKFEFVFMLSIAAGLYFYSAPSLILAPLGCLLASTISHIIYTYVSTSVVLLYMSVVTHAVTNIIKRLAVVIAMIMAGQQDFSFKNAAFLLLCGVGLALYAREKLRNKLKVTEVNIRERVSVVQKYVVILTAILMSLHLMMAIWSTNCGIPVQEKIIGLHEKGIRTFEKSASAPASMSSVDHQKQPENNKKTVSFVVQRKQYVHFKHTVDKMQVVSRDMITRVLNGSESVSIIGPTATDTVTLHSVACLQVLLSTMSVSITCTSMDMVGCKLHSKSNDVVIMMVLNTKSKQNFKDLLQSYTQRLVVLVEANNAHNIAKSVCDTKKTGRSVQVISLGYFSEVDEKAICEGVSIKQMPYLAFNIDNVLDRPVPYYDVIWEVPSVENPCGLMSDTGHCLGVTGAHSTKNMYTGTVFDVDYMCMLFLRGRVAVVDNLYHHVVCSTLGIPHVILDKDKKWMTDTDIKKRMAPLLNSKAVHIVDTAKDAAAKVMLILEEFESELPPLAEASQIFSQYPKK